MHWYRGVVSGAAARLTLGVAVSGNAGPVTDGLVVLAGWVMFGLLLLALGVVVLRGGGDSR
jgi:hypothetical protein